MNEKKKNVRSGAWSRTADKPRFPLVFPAFSNGEALPRPTAMLTCNLASMDAGEAIRGNPIDGAVPLVACNKTTPALTESRACAAEDAR